MPQGRRTSVEQVRAVLSVRLRERRKEIGQLAMARVYGVFEPTEAVDTEYIDGLRAAVSAALDYGLDAIERGEERASPPPEALLAQARLAARSGVSLDTVLRRYFAGYTLLGDVVMQEVDSGLLFQGAALQRVLRAQAALFDRLIAAVTEEFNREVKGSLGSTEERLAERIKSLLAGELINTAELEYDLKAHHLGVIAAGPEAEEGIRRLATALDRRLLLVHRAGGIVWAWLGGRHRVDHNILCRNISETLPTQASIAIGEPAAGLPGWRLTHQQAKAALPIALRSHHRPIRYGDVALLAAMLKDHTLATSLHELYVAPLAQERDGGVALRETLRAYFAAGRNASSAAAAMGVSRQTVNSRLRTIEERLYRPLSSCAAEIEAALRLEDLGSLRVVHTADAGLVKPSQRSLV